MDKAVTKIKTSFFEKNKFIIVFSVSFVVLAFFIVMIFFVIFSSKKELKVEKNNTPIVSKTIEEEVAQPALPVGDIVSTEDGKASSTGKVVEVENVSFGDFYKVSNDGFSPKMNEYELPMNVKSDVANYYDVSRKINLDSSIEKLNKNGFTVIDNPFSDEVDNFYLAYRTLKNNQIPALVTSDFLIYYYQNKIKSIFKEIESSVFYDNLWETNKKLYKRAKERYDKEVSLLGISNDVYLEGARKELAFFATTLSILSPTKEQISENVGLSSDMKFSKAEASNFSFSLPEYLKDDVSKEVALIRGMKEKTKSPVLLFERDYKDFAVPERYKNNVRLNNFYQASKWLNSIFPLYYRDDNCPNCLLDKDDWRISMCSALLLSEDLSSSRELKNQWAKIYKMMSFFEGVQDGLTYIHYKESFDEIFGSDKSVADIMSNDNIDDNLKKIQDKLYTYDFLEIEGSVDKRNMDELGVKMLMSSYWPNDYVFNQLTFPNVTEYLGYSDLDKKLNNTYCKINGVNNRCFGFGFDIMNLIYDVNGSKNRYIYENTSYYNYDSQLEKIKDKLSQFNTYNWHRNNYWTTLDILRKTLNTPEELKYVTVRNKEYDKKKMNTAIATWINLQLPADILAPFKESEFKGIGNGGGDTGFMKFSYIEPDLILVKELMANIGMISEMLSVLKINDYNNTVLGDLETVKKKFENVEYIIKKELSGESLTENEYKFINDFVKEFQLKEKGRKILVFKSEKEKVRARLQESLEGVKLLVFTYKDRGKNLFAVGPVFNYWEKK